MNALFQQVSTEDIETVLGLMREFYPQQEMQFDEQVATNVIKDVINDFNLGRLYLIFHGPELAGYFALTFSFSLEFHGKFGLFDELYIREPFRRKKLGRAAVDFAERICREQHIKALRLEVGIPNTVAQALYTAEGFHQDERYLMTKWL